MQVSCRNALKCVLGPSIKNRRLCLLILNQLDSQKDDLTNYVVVYFVYKSTLNFEIKLELKILFITFGFAF